MITESLDRFYRNLVRLKRPVVDLLQPGLPRGEVLAKASVLGLEFPDELIDLYVWRNGIDLHSAGAIGKISLFPGYYFPNLDCASTDYLAFKEDPRWKLHWFPVFTNGSGDFYAVDCKAGRVIDFLRDDPDQVVGYENMFTMLQTLVKCIEKGVFFTAEGGYFEADDDEWFRIARVCNPGLTLHEDS